MGVDDGGVKAMASASQFSQNTSEFLRRKLTTLKERLGGLQKESARLQLVAKPSPQIKGNVEDAEVSGARDLTSDALNCNEGSDALPVIGDGTRGKADLVASQDSVATFRMKGPRQVSKAFSKSSLCLQDTVPLTCASLGCSFRVNRLGGLYCCGLCLEEGCDSHGRFCEGIDAGVPFEANASTLKCATIGCNFARHSNLSERVQFGPYCCQRCAEEGPSSHGNRCEQRRRLDAGALRLRQRRLCGYATGAGKVYGQRARRSRQSTRLTAPAQDKDVSTTLESSTSGASGAGHCFLPGTVVYQPGRDPVDVAALSSEQRLWGRATVVKACRTLPRRPREIVKMSMQIGAGASVSIRVTASHMFPVLIPYSKSYSPTPAWDIKKRDSLRTLSGTGMVVSVDHCVLETECIQVEFASRKSTLYVAEEGTTLSQKSRFIEAYGEMAPRPTRDRVKILRFSNFDTFKEVLLESPELAPCCNDLRERGYSANLDDILWKDLGGGKMFVDSGLAPQVVDALNARKKKLTPREVVVSYAYEKVVLDLVRNHIGTKRRRKVFERNHGIKDEEMLSLSLARTHELWLQASDVHLDGDSQFAACTVERTFVHLRPPKAGTVSTKSTTEARDYRVKPLIHRRLLERPLGGTWKGH